MSAAATSPKEPSVPRSGAGVRLCGLLAEFRDPDALREAARRVRAAGFSRWDCHSPFPIHGIDDAIGIRLTKLPIVVFFFGLMGCLTALLLQWWTNAAKPADYPMVPTFLQGYGFLISGKPFWSFQANIPVIFELTVLFSALCAGIGMLVANNLPWFSNPLFNSERFRRVTNDAFFIRVDSTDSKFHLQQTQGFLASLGAIAVERIEDTIPTPAETRLPGGLVKTGIVLACLGLIPLAFIAVARSNKSSSPRIHLIQDMDNQEKFKAQAAHPLFKDKRAMREPIAGAIARGDLREDDRFYRGYKMGVDPKTNQPAPVYFETFPAQVPVNEAFVQRGQQRFNIYCSPCHGVDGSGRGMVNQRALELGGGWVQAADLRDADRRSRPVGQLFNTITSGVRTMPPYGDQIGETDRWAIVAYVRALQKAEGAAIEELPEKERSALRKR
ncbi:MAG: DUF3341 domain-containing protein [Planctomycetes bacterium]|nr:DUF3341 domain-containing protein [Planctomycetota bacterium]